MACERDRSCAAPGDSARPQVRAAAAHGQPARALWPYQQSSALLPIAKVSSLRRRHGERVTAAATVSRPTLTPMAHADGHRWFFGAEAESGVLYRYARPTHNRHAQQPNNYCTFFLHSRHNLRSSLSLHSLHSMSTSPKPCTSDRWRRPADEGSSLDGCSGLPAPVPKITASFRFAPHTAETQVK